VVGQSGTARQTSIAGKAIPIGWGRNRIAGNLIWYNDFVAKPASNGNAGKGGGGGGKGGTTAYDYSAAVIIAVCQGPVAGFTGVCWANEVASTLGNYNLSAFVGDYSQTTWGYMVPPSSGGFTGSADPTTDNWSDMRGGAEGGSNAGGGD
jgi:hypothetical protein